MFVTEPGEITLAMIALQNRHWGWKEAQCIVKAAIVSYRGAINEFIRDIHAGCYDLDTEVGNGMTNLIYS
jgi:hypothetical protein